VSERCALADISTAANHPNEGFCIHRNQLLENVGSIASKLGASTRVDVAPHPFGGKPEGLVNRLDVVYERAEFDAVHFLQEFKQIVDWALIAAKETHPLRKVCILSTTP